jgi:O-antigen ligase
MNTAASSYLRAEPESRYLWIAIAFGLVAFAIGCGVSLALGELEAMYVTAALALCIAVMFDFRIGAIALVLMMPLQDTTLFPHALMGVTGLNPANLLLAATLASCFLKIGLQGAGALLDRRLVWLYALPVFAAAAIGAPHAGEIIPYFYERELIHFTSWPGYLRDILIRPSLLVVVGLLLGAAAVHSQKPERFLIPIGISVWLMALVVIGFVAASGVRIGALADASQREFFSELGIHANSLGRVFAAAYALLLFPWWETRRAGLKLFLFCTIGVLSFALLVTFSRGAFVGFILINLLFLVWKFNLRLLGLALLGLVVAAMVMPEYVIGRVTVGFDTGDANDVSAGRVDGIWLPLLPELFRSPVWGNGLGSVMWSLPMQIGAMLPVTHPHNAYLEALLDMGLVGLVLMLAYFWHVWRRLRQLGGNAWLSPEMRGFFQGAAAALLCFLVTGMAGSSLRPDSDFVYLWFAIGMMYGIAARKPGG